uniref:Protein krueppel n=1 Tax=Heterorhabditis bacteriophora TaxID=37862 RepID=A0A1I7X7I2_HETBA
MVDIDKSPLNGHFAIHMKREESANESGERHCENVCAENESDEALRISSENEDEDGEPLNVESPDVEEMDGSDTSSSIFAVGTSPQGTHNESPGTLTSVILTADSPQSTSEPSSTLSNNSIGGSTHPEKRHICEICGKGFPYLSILESHKRCHTGEKPFNCHFCDKKFAQKATLQVHERTHTGERPYKCRYCEKTFAQYGTKTVHEKSAHLGIRNYKCPKCDKCLSSPSALYTHKKTHGEKTFQCDFCTKTFALKNYLKLHVKQVHEHNERKHVCRYCNKGFAYAGSLQVHVRTHTGERPYQCAYCPKAFASQGNLQSHERTHTGERPYTCGTCGRSFIQVAKRDEGVIKSVHWDIIRETKQSIFIFIIGVNFVIRRSQTKETCKFINGFILEKNHHSPSSSNPTTFSSYPQLSMPDLLVKLPTVSAQFGFQPQINTPPAMPFRAPEAPPPDFGPLTASKPPFQPEASMPESLSAFHTPSYQKNDPPTSLLDPNLVALKGLLDAGLGSNLLQPTNLLSQHILNTQLLLQQMQNNETLVSLLGQNLTLPQTTSLPQPTPLAPSLLGSLFPAGLLSGLPISGQTGLQTHYSVDIKTDPMLA